MVQPWYIIMILLFWIQSPTMHCNTRPRPCHSIHFPKVYRFKRMIPAAHAPSHLAAVGGLDQLAHPEV